MRYSDMVSMYGIAGMRIGLRLHAIIVGLRYFFHKH